MSATSQRHWFQHPENDLPDCGRVHGHRRGEARGGPSREPEPQRGFQLIPTRLSNHAARQAQRRGITLPTLDFILDHADRSGKLRGHSHALWVSRKGRECLKWAGFAPREIDRTRGIRLIVSTFDDVVITVEHTLTRRRWA